MKILLTIVATLLAVGVLYLLGVVKELRSDVEQHEYEIDDLWDSLHELGTDLSKLGSKKGDK